ncbi:MAG: class I tRNA ligase family protein, partial [Euzebyaceae bacterium]|nr:class I tRNA ligase family protein [Euzebyaceae bacterium]
VPEPAAAAGDAEAALAADLRSAIDGMAAFDRLDFKKGLEDLWFGIGAVNRYVEARAPWKLHKHGATDELGRCLYTCVDALRVIAVLISPVMPDAAARLWAKLGLGEPLSDQRYPASVQPGLLPVGAEVDRGELLFPKLEE